MNSNTKLFVCSLLSAVIAVALYRFFEEPQKIILREPTTIAKYTNLSAPPADNFAPIPPSNSRYEAFNNSGPTSFTTAAKSVIPGVVNIRALQSSGFEWWGTKTRSFGASSGSGVIISPDGYIITNNHVIEEGDEFEITLNNNEEHKASLVGHDPSTDLALLKIKGKVDLPYLAFGNSDSLQIGEWVLAVGNPFNLESTVTAGIVSAKGRSIDILEGDYKIESFIQTDAAVNPGNSGGALVNTFGELIGINTAIITRSGKYEGYSFAVPSNLVRKVVSDLREYGEVQRGLLGVGIGEVTTSHVKSLGLPSMEGVHITRVTPESGADEAGLESGDVIVSINEVKVPTIPVLQEIVGRYRPGNVLKIDYIRNGRIYSTNVTLRNKSNTTELTTMDTRDIATKLGFELRNLKPEEQRRLKSKGVYVISIEVGSVIEEIEMDPGYIITKVNDETVESIADMTEKLRKATGKVLLEGFYENYPGEYYYTFRMR